MHDRVSLSLTLSFCRACALAEEGSASGAAAAVPTQAVVVSGVNDAAASAISGMIISVAYQAPLPYDYGITVPRLSQVRTPYPEQK